MAHSYITDIKLTKYKKEQVKEVLQFLNDNSGTEVFLTKGMRPVSIKEVTAKEMAKLIEPEIDSTVVGLAEHALGYCKIYVRENLDEKDFSNVLMHEIVHCFGYDHTEKQHDLMSPVEDDISEISRVVWANRVGNLIRRMRF